METLVLIPQELSLALRPGGARGREASVSVWTSMEITRGALLYPFQGTIRIDKLHVYSYAPDHDQQIGEHILAMDEVLLLSQYNEQRFLSLTNNCQCGFNGTNAEPPLLSCEPSVQSDSFIEKVSVNKSEILLFSDDIGKNIDAEAIQTSITTDLSSDHCGQLVALKCKVVKQVNKSSVFVPVNKKRMVRFRHNIGKRLPLLPVGTTVDTQYNNLSDCINKEFNTIFTPKKVSHSQCKSFSDWATAGIYKSRQRLYDLYAEKSYNHNEEFILYVRNYSKLFKKVCYAAKSLNIKNKIKNSTNKTKMTWKIIDSETGRVRDRNQDIELCVDNTIIKSNEEIAIVFDKYFSDIPISTTKSLQSSPALAESLLKDNVNECKVSFSFRPIGADDIVRIFRTIDIKNTTDLWGISVKIISSIIDVIAPHLAIIFNNCIKSGEFPDLMKHSKVIPLFKAGSMSDPSNFRPISVLPTCSKIFEKIILNQLVSHFNVNKLLHNNQFGFTKGRSTADAGVELYRYIVKAWEESHDALGVFCDLSKTFDCVQHETLIGKLRHYGIKNTALNLLTSYLHGRTQKVEVNGKRSSGSAVDMGVPQGSILGPFLFLVYINDLPFMVERKHQIVLFADDTSLIFKIKRQITNFDDVNNALSSIVHWF
ncbi:unnamed protein product [Pieris macdunnoughi]|uniref:Reverse transcriptase domain-containing protein n=1 Tax=Pieris macdunnoughi TaxID=345717 RepID=A0A821URH8_9NEOP|nr:unnamed protein product [Pieris macdunnoughi]